MRPLALRLREYRTWQSLDLDLPEGCAALVGANGAGKSSIVNAIDLALFGGRDLARHRARGAHPDEPTMVELTFEHAGQVYRVRRTVGARTSLDFEVAGEHELDDGLGDAMRYGAQWAPLTRESQAATQALIEETIGLTRATFRASAFLAQGDGAAFTEAQPRDRKQILAEILGLDIWDRLNELAKGQRGGAEQTASTLTGRIELAEHEIAGRRDTVAERDSADVRRAEAEQRIIEAEQELEQVAGRIADARAARERLDTAEQLCRDRQQAVSDNQAGRDRLAERAQRIGGELAMGDAYAEQAKRLPAAERALQEARDKAQAAENAADQARGLRALLAQAARERADAQAEQETLQARLAELVADTPATCEACGQSLTSAEARAQLARTIGQQVDAAHAGEQQHAKTLIDEAPRLKTLEQTAADIGEPVGNLEHEVRQAQHAAEQVARLDELRRQLVDVASDAAKLELQGKDLVYAAWQAEQDADAARAAAGASLLGLEEQHGKLRLRLTDLRAQLADHERAVARCDERLERMGRIENELAATREEYDKAQTELDILRRLERAYSRDGIPALIVENAAIPAIETEANTILAELGTGYTVQLRTQRATAKGELREALDIVVSDGSREAAYEDFSGGERTRINLSLRLALSRLLAHRRGAEVGLLVLDEPDYLDDEGMGRLIAVLRRLEHDFGRVYLISHVPVLREAFDQVLQVEKVDGRSRLAGVREAVAA